MTYTPTHRYDIRCVYDQESDNLVVQQGTTQTANGVYYLSSLASHRFLGTTVWKDIGIGNSIQEAVEIMIWKAFEGKHDIESVDLGDIDLSSPEVTAVRNILWDFVL